MPQFQALRESSASTAQQNREVALQDQAEMVDATLLGSRQTTDQFDQAVDVDVRGSTPTNDAFNAFEALLVTQGGGVFVTGWVDDGVDPVRYVQVNGADWRVTIEGHSLARHRRADVDASLQRTTPQALGYFGLVFENRALKPTREHRVQIGFQSGAVITGLVSGRLIDDEELRNVALSYLAGSDYLGDPQVKAMVFLERGLGASIFALNRKVVEQLVAAPVVQRFGDIATSPVGSIIVCLYGRPEYLFLQCALFSDLPGVEDYEFIYVSNSPELGDRLMSEARRAASIYGLTITLVILPGNAGFAGANNAAVAAARTHRLLFVNPDVFPKDAQWALKHSALLLSRPAAETTLFGAPLYYDDGSLMHGGMYFELDQGLAFEGHKGVAWQLLRVEHFGKGAPAGEPRFHRPRPVPAVTGAFISIERSWFETLGGFSTDYVFGHYEDADLCLKSLEAGVAPWLHDLRLWHLEGKGSTRLPVHEGGSLINRWLFTSRWGQTVTQGLLGAEPTHPAFARSA